MKPAFFISNRNKIIEATQEGLLVFAGYRQLQQKGDMAARFEQEANFWWLTGIEAPGWWLMIDRHSARSYLIAPEVEAVHELFDGSLSNGDAQRVSGVDEVLSAKDGEALLKKYATEHTVVFTLGKDSMAKHYDFVLNPGPMAMLSKLKRLYEIVIDCRIDLARLRAIKQPEEIAAIKKAVALTVDAFKDIKPRLGSLRHEYQVEAEFSHYFRSRGAEGHAYEPIVAGGKNACTLHYTQNNSSLKKSELLLLDIGARVGGYAADITRTYGIGEPTERQLAVHQVVEAAHREIIALLKPGLSIEVYAEKVDEIMKSALGELGLLKSPTDYRKYFPHAISHGLGIDVHDSLGRPSEFLEGMVLTVEPGIYVPEEGIGVRIEDDILITAEGAESLSAALPTSL